MVRFTLRHMLQAPFDVFKAMQESPVEIIDDKTGSKLAVLVQHNEYFALREVADIAKDPQRYLKLLEPISQNEPIAELADIFPH
jgi:hypothetical protein